MPRHRAWSERICSLTISTAVEDDHGRPRNAHGMGQVDRVLCTMPALSAKVGVMLIAAYVTSSGRG
jgi:hypothetical protein